MTSPPQRCPVIDLADLLKGWVAAEAIPSLALKGIQSDSRRVKPGDLFLAIRGANHHGLDFASTVMESGCVAIVYDPEGACLEAIEGRATIPLIPVSGLTEKQGMLADRFYGAPSSSMAVIAVTGTNGKTSCTHFLAEAMALSTPSAVVGTLGWGQPGALNPTQHTTPDAIELQRILGLLRDQDVGLVAMEASSHGLSQGRMKGIRFKGAVFTNFSRDHLDYHGTMEAYLDSKLSLASWPGLEFIVFNAEGAFAEPLLNRDHGNLQLLGFCSEKAKVAMGAPLLRYGEPKPNLDGMEFEVAFKGLRGVVRTGLYGDFNVENVTATLATLLCLGIDFDAAIAAVAHLKAVPGRMERVVCGDRQVVVDYAHTPDALATVLRGARAHNPASLWVVFGCGGDRDRGKRSQMGAIASEMADHIVLTDDNPRSEDGDRIVEEILAGITRPSAQVIRDRRAAIEHAIQALGPEDFLVVAGKGHETTQEISGIKYPFNDRSVIEQSCLKFSLNRAETSHFTSMQRSAQG
jgi:UDP-N-acetylmuramoyl-L-alanyl-D-glutamate--2,6-diaminopimelate ligase